MRKLSIILAATIALSVHFSANAALPTAEHLKKQLLDSKVLPADQPVNTRAQGSTAYVSTFKKTNAKDAEASCRDDAFNVAKTILELNQSISFVVVDFFEVDHHFYRRATVDRKFLKRYSSSQKDGKALISGLKLERPSRLSRKELQADPFGALTRSRYGDLPASVRTSRPLQVDSTSSSAPHKPDEFEVLRNQRSSR